MNLFYKKISALILISFIPLVLIFCMYLYTDPYNDLPINYNRNIKYIFHSLSDFTTKKLISNSSKKNSFILGSSKSLTFTAKRCHKVIFKKNKNVNPFHYAQWGESIGGVYNKLIFLNYQKHKLNYIFIFIDPNLTFRKNGLVHDFDHYLISGISQPVYYLKHVKEFFNPKNIYFRENMKILFHKKVKLEYQFNFYTDKNYNDLHYFKNRKKSIIQKKYIDSIKRYSQAYLFKSVGKQMYFTKQISKIEKSILLKIKNILVKNESKYTLVITPTLNGVQLHKADFQILTKVFGKSNILNASGNNLFTYKNILFNDSIHYNGFINEVIMDSISKKNYNEGFLQ